MSRYVEIQKEILTETPFANKEISLVPYSVRTGVESRKNQAIIKLQELKAEFQKLISDNAVYVFALNGDSDQKAEFSQLLEDEADSISLPNGIPFDAEVGVGWWYANGQKAGELSTVHQIQILDELRKTMVDLNLKDVTSPVIPTGTFLTSEAGCVEFVRTLTTDQCGASFRLALLEEEAKQSALDVSWAGDTLQPVIFTVENTNAKEAAAISSLKPNRVVTVDLSVNKLSPEFVKKVLSKIVSGVKKSKSNQ
jgi:hypothetical protein